MKTNPIKLYQNEQKTEYIKNRVVITGNRNGRIYESIRKQKEDDDVD